MMRVYILKDVERVGLAGQIINVSEGYAQNFLLPKKLAVVVTADNEKFFKVKKIQEGAAKEILNSKVAMLAERIKALHISIKERVHDDGKLYGAVGADEVVALLKAREIVVNKKQIEFEKNIKAVGEHKVTVRLSSKLKPQFILKVEAAMMSANHTNHGKTSAKSSK